MWCQNDHTFVTFQSSWSYWQSDIPKQRALCVLGDRLDLRHMKHWMNFQCCWELKPYRCRTDHLFHGVRANETRLELLGGTLERDALGGQPDILSRSVRGRRGTVPIGQALVLNPSEEQGSSGLSPCPSR